VRSRSKREKKAGDGGQRTKKKGERLLVARAGGICWS